MNRVFVSYSHDSPEHADKVLALSDRLIAEGVDCILDQYEESPPEGWPRWMDKHIKEADFVLMVCTETYYKRVMGEEEPGKGQGVRWEGNLIYQRIYNADTKNSKFVPLLFEGCKTEYIPTPLQGATRYYVETEEGYEDLYRRLTNQPKAIKPIVGKLKKLRSRQRKQDFFDVKVMLSKLPTTGHELFGREEELETLHKAWDDEHTNILSLVAWGGVGKTALVNEWLNQMGFANYRGAGRVYGWSFYSQGTREERQVSADEFLAYALEWFGDADPKEGSPWDKGIRLAELVRQQMTLLILDGLEPLQYPPGPMKGQLKDQGLQALLKELARSNPGLCIITTREKVENLEHVSEPALRRIFLENLSDEAGMQLLKSLGVKGTDEELKVAVGEFGGHALALNLLGSYLATVHEGEIRKWDLVPRLTDEEEQGGHAKRVMESYEIWLKDKSELDILYMMGLFDRPAPRGAIEVIRTEPVIEGLTDKLQNLSKAKWKFALKHLRELRLLAKQDEIEPDKLDCHPLVREHFGEKLQKEKPEAWKEAHSRLYEYYKGLPEKLYGKELPDTLEEMEPLFAAVIHGCLAGRHQETFDNIYWERIIRRKDFINSKLGAFGADLASVSCFFDKPWSEPAFSLIDEAKAVILGFAGYALRGLGRLKEAAEPMESGLKLHTKQKDWGNVARDAGNLSELYLILGEVERAVEYGRKSLNYVERSNNSHQKIDKRTKLADSLHTFGELTEAEKLLVEAEIMQRERDTNYPFLFSFWNIKFCDLLLTQCKWASVLGRIERSKDWMKEYGVLLDIALDRLSLGRAYLLETVTESGGWRKGLAKAEGFLNKAVDGLRESGNQDDIPRGLLARAELYLYQRNWEKAWRDLEQAREIAERGEMNLYLADYHLEAARVCLAEREQKEDRISNKEYRMMKLNEAREHYEEAKKRIEEMGYHRRGPEVLLIQAELEIVEGDKKRQAKETLKKAKKRIDEMGCHRWDVEVERLKELLKKATKTK